MIRPVIVIVGLLFSFGFGARAQEGPVEVSVGPQLTTLGIGLGVDVRVIPQLSLSAEYSILPIREIRPDGEFILDIEDVNEELDFVVKPDVRGGLLAVNWHPLGGKFALGLGVFFGGYAFDATLRPDEPIEIGDETYTPEEVGTVFGDFALGDTAPAIYLGWRGRGIHFGAGIATRAPSDVALSASGPISAEPEFRQELAAEQAEIEDELGRVKVLPFLRLGWQFGL